MKTLHGWAALAAIALGAIAVWPFLPHEARASATYVAPVQPDYRVRDETIAFYESRVARDKRDQISATLLAGQYMQRYREAGDVDDIMRALAQARRALRLQRQNNAAADNLLASGYTALHKFDEALRYERAAQSELPFDSNAPAQIASLEMELGHYAQARDSLARASKLKLTPTVMAVQARYDELTGDNAAAIKLLAAAMASTDSNYDNGAQARAWYHFRLGEVLFESGNASAGRQREREALAIFPQFELAYRALARICWYQRDARCALEAAEKGAQIIPTPETLGYEADAQQAIGNETQALRTRALIRAVERIGNAYHLNDRLLAMYYADHGVRLADAYRIAQREVAARGDEIYAQDTLAWTAARAGRWDAARRAIARATRFHTQDFRIVAHARYIEQKAPAP